MPRKQLGPKGVRISDEDWEILRIAARMRGTNRNAFIVDAVKRAALSTLTGVALATPVNGRLGPKCEEKSAAVAGEFDSQFGSEATKALAASGSEGAASEASRPAA